MSREEAFLAVAAELGHDFNGPIRIGGNYAPLMRVDDTIHVSGQIPRIGSEVLVIGAAGREVALPRARYAASVCAMRALALLRQSLGSLEPIRHLPRLTVYVRCDDTFTLHSEVADAASEVLHRVLGEAGRHARSSVGVLQLPKGATVELDLIALV